MAVLPRRVPWGLAQRAVADFLEREKGAGHMSFSRLVLKQEQDSASPPLAEMTLVFAKADENGVCLYREPGAGTIGE